MDRTRQGTRSGKSVLNDRGGRLSGSRVSSGAGAGIMAAVLAGDGEDATAFGLRGFPRESRGRGRCGSDWRAGKMARRLRASSRNLGIKGNRAKAAGKWRLMKRGIIGI